MAAHRWRGVATLTLTVTLSAAATTTVVTVVVMMVVAAQQVPVRVKVMAYARVVMTTVQPLLAVATTVQCK